MTQKTESSVAIQQALHGYTDGHRLIECSVELPPRALRAMAALSDLSGPTVTADFESYYTTYPVPDTDFVAFAKTWLATEMPRPGCVWTHSLLIGSAELQSLVNLRALMNFFVRPAGPVRTGIYQRAILTEFSKDEPEWTDAAFIDPFNSRLAVLRALYGSPESTVLLTAENGEVYAPLIVDIWSQQWLALRQRFSFCTGALSNRELDGKPFDVLVSPQRIRREILRTNPLAIDVSDSYDVDVEPWLAEAARDLTTGFGELRNYFRRTAAPDSSRNDFRGLVRLFLADASSNTNADRLVEILAQEFPDSDSGVGIKRNLLSQARSHHGRDGGRLASVLLVLARIEDFSPFSQIFTSLTDVASTVRSQDGYDVTRLICQLSQIELNPFGTELLRALVLSLRENDLNVLVSASGSTPSVHPLIVNLRPDLAATESIWRVDEATQRRMLDTFAGLSNRTKQLDRAVSNAIINSASPTLSLRAVEIFGDDFIVSVLEHLADTGVGSDRERGWVGVVRLRLDAALKWLSTAADVPMPLLDALASMTNSEDPLVIDAGSCIWWSHLQHNEIETLNGLSPRAASFLLALAFRSSETCSGRLGASVFGAVHEAASRGRIAYEAWEPLEKMLPRVPWHLEWDRCERLRRGLIDRIVNQKWNGEALGYLNFDPDVIRLLVRTARGLRSQKKLQMLLRDVTASTPTLLQIKDLLAAPKNKEGWMPEND